MKMPLAFRFFFDNEVYKKTMMRSIRILNGINPTDDFMVLSNVVYSYIRFVSPEDPDRFCGSVHHGRKQTKYEGLVRLVKIFVEVELGVPLSKIEDWNLRSSVFNQSPSNDCKLIFLTLYIAHAVSTHPRFNDSNLTSFSVDKFPSFPVFKQLFRCMDELSEPNGGYSFANKIEDDKENAVSKSFAARSSSNLDSSLLDPASGETNIIFEDIPDDIKMAEMDLEFVDEKLLKRANELEHENVLLMSKIAAKEKRIGVLEKDFSKKEDQINNYHRIKVFAEDRSRQIESQLKQVERERDAAKADATAIRAEAAVSKAALAVLQADLQACQGELNELTKLYKASLDELKFVKKVINDFQCHQQDAAGDAQQCKLQTQISIYKSHITTLTPTIDEARQYFELVQQLKNENAKLSHEIEALTLDVEAREIQISELKNDIAQADKRVEQAENQIVVVKKTLDETTSKVEILQKDNLKISKDNRFQTKSMEQMRQRIDDDEEYVSKLNETNQKLSITIAEQDEALKSVNSKHDKLKVQYSSIVNDKEVAATEIKTLQIKLAKLTAELQTKTDECHRLYDECDDLRDQVSGFQRCFTNKNAEQREIENTLVVRQAEIENLYEKIRKTDSKLEVERDRTNELRVSLEKSVEDRKLLENEIAHLSGDQIRLLADKERLVKAFENIQIEMDSKLALLGDANKRVDELSATIRSFKAMARTFEDDLSFLRIHVADISDLMAEFASKIFPTVTKLRQNWIDMHEMVDTSRRYNLSLEEELSELRKQQFSRTPSLQDEFCELGFPLNQEGLVFDEQLHSDPDSGHATAISSPELTPRDPMPAETDKTYNTEKEDELVVTPVTVNQVQSSRSIFPVGAFLAFFLLIAIVFGVFQLDLAKIIRFFRLKYEVIGRVPF